MVPLYAARIEDLGPGDFVRLECIACGHDALIPPSSLLNGLRLPVAGDTTPRARRSCRLSGPGISLPAPTRDALLRALYQRLMFMDRMNHLRPEVPIIYVALVDTLV
jgi:hypothetical protein